MNTKTELALRVGSWPGYGERHNQFIELFLDGLQSAGCNVFSLETIDDFVIRDLDIVVLHWAERVFFAARNRREILSRIARLIYTLRTMSPHTKIVWLVHNLAPHDPTFMQRLIWPTYMSHLTRQVDAVLTLSPGTLDIVSAAFPRFKKLPMNWFWHPAYPNATLTFSEVQVARWNRGWTSDETVIGYCGQIRAYKGVEELIEAFRATDAPSLRLLIAGLVQSEFLASRLQDLAHGDRRIRLELGNLSAEGFREGLNCCDVIAAPFREYLHSGSFIHALSAARPVLTPDTPFSRSLQDKLGKPWVRLYDGALLPDTLEHLAKINVPMGQPDLTDFSIAATGTRCAAFLRTITET